MDTYRLFNEQEHKTKYSCHGADSCSSSWTYDDWHCTGCHWKGMGRMDLEYAKRYGDTKLLERADALRKQIELKNQPDPEAEADSKDSI